MVTETDFSGSSKYSDEKLPVTAMSSHMRTFGIPKSLKSYYVAEILGKSRIETSADLAQFETITFIATPGEDSGEDDLHDDSYEESAPAGIVDSRYFSL